MKEFKLIVVFILCFTSLFSQMVIKDSYVYISSNTYLTLTKNDPTGLKNIGTVGGVYCQNETAKIKWLVTGSVLGLYEVPYVASNGTKIPFTLNITSTSSGTSIEFNTYETANNNTPYPSLVNFMTNDANVDNSTSVVDRFWQIKFNGYPVAEPKVTVTFTYADFDLVGNTITESNLTMQRYNDVADKWGDWIYSPYSNVTSNTITVNLANIQDYYETWTAVDAGDALPIEFLEIKESCDNGLSKLQWRVASETNADYYRVTKTSNSDTVTVGTVSAFGNSSSELTYQLVDEQPNMSLTYYTLYLVDLNGNEKNITSVSSSCQSKNNWTFDNNVLKFNMLAKSILLYDVSGRLLVTLTNTSKILFPKTSQTYYVVASFDDYTITTLKLYKQ